MAAAPRPVRLHVRGVLRRPARAASHDLVAPADRRAAAIADGAGPRRSTSRRPGRRQRVAGEAEAVARLARELVDGGSTWTIATGIVGRSTLDDVLDRRAVQRPGRRDPPAAATRSPGRDRRQIPGPGGAGQHLLDDDLVARARAARDGLPVQPAPPQRRDVAGTVRHDRRRARPTCCGSGPGRRSRCDWRTHSAGSRSLRRDRRADTRRRDDASAAAEPDARAPCTYHRRMARSARASRARLDSGAGRSVRSSRASPSAAPAISPRSPSPRSSPATWPARPRSSGAPGAAVVLGAALGAALLSRLMVRRGRRIGLATGYVRRRRRRRRRDHRGHRRGRSRCCSSGRC